jgi:hypothetical protein
MDMDTTQRWSECDHNDPLTGILQYQRNNTKYIELVSNEEYGASFKAGLLTRCGVDDRCIEEQEGSQWLDVIHRDQEGFVTRNRKQNALMIFYRSNDKNAFMAWVERANQIVPMVL